MPISAPKRKRNEDNDPYWEISNKRRITIQKFKGKTLVALREYYEKDGKQLPGKQGMSLTIEQFATLLAVLDDVKKTLKADFNESVTEDDEEGVSADGDDKEEEKEKPTKRETKKRKLSVATEE